MGHGNFITAHITQPNVTDVYRMSTGPLAIRLSDQLCIVASDAEWDAIVTAVDALRASEKKDTGDCAECGAGESFSYSTNVCDGCARAIVGLPS